MHIDINKSIGGDIASSLAIAACGAVNVELAAAGVPQVIYMYIYIYIYYRCIYVYVERERDVYIYVCIYPCIYKPRDCCMRHRKT